MTKVINRYGRTCVVSAERAAEMIKFDKATLPGEVVKPEETVEEAPVVAPTEPEAPVVEEAPAEEEAPVEEAPIDPKTKEELQAILDEKGVEYDKRLGADSLQELVDLNS